MLLNSTPIQCHQVHGPGKTLTASSISVTGENTGAYFTFNVGDNKTVGYKFAISYVSVENARENLAAENTGWDFNGVKNNAIHAWNTLLSKVEVSGSSKDRTTQFYTHLYHTLIHPSISNDVNGDYLGADYKVHKAAGYTNYTGLSNWDVYRTQVQLMAMIAPKETSDVITSTVNFAKQSGGGFPRWVMANIETGIMQGDPTTLVVANAYAFGAKNFDTKAALAVMRKGSDVPGTKSQAELTRPFEQLYLDKGFMKASMELEYTSADFAIGQFALQTEGDKSLHHKYVERAQKWKNLYNPQTNWLQSRNDDGSWKDQHEDWREGSYKNYFWMVPYNLRKLADTIGGNEVADKRLDTLFSKLNADYYQDWFASGNEPDFEVPVDLQLDR